jgi:hypothetical protein
MVSEKQITLKCYQTMYKTSITMNNITLIGKRMTQARYHMCLLINTHNDPILRNHVATLRQAH